MDKLMIRGKLFGTLLNAIIEHCEEQFPVTPQVLNGILAKLASAPDMHEIKTKEFMEILNPELEQYLSRLEKINRTKFPRRRAKTPGRTDTEILAVLLFAGSRNCAKKGS